MALYPTELRKQSRTTRSRTSTLPDHVLKWPVLLSRKRPLLGPRISDFKIAPGLTFESSAPFGADPGLMTVRPRQGDNYLEQFQGI